MGSPGHTPFLVALALVLSVASGPLRAGDAPALPTALDAQQKATAPPPEPSGYRMEDFRSPVPATLSGARVIGTGEAEKIFKERSAILIDVFPKGTKPSNLPPETVWRDPQHDTIEGAHWLPNVGYGGFPAGVEDYFRTRLASLAAGEPGKPLMFFCQRNCWMSWNAAKRAIEWGYKDVIWYPEGTDGWLDAGNDLVSMSSTP